MFLPICKKDMAERGWNECDFIVVTGDAYVDHSTFGTAIISRVLEHAGYRVGIIAQPDWKNNNDFTKLGKPRYGFMVNSGNIDSMVAHYTVNKRKRSTDAYSPANRAGLRPDRAVTVYCKKIREIYGEIPIVIGGLEASLRRFAHYDYWSDTVMPSILFDSDADILSFGMGERQTVQIANALRDGEREKLYEILGICYITDNAAGIKGITLPSFEAVSSSKEKYAEACRIQLDEMDAVRGKRLIQPHGKKYLIQNKPQPPLSSEELDEVYGLPFENYYHPSYEAVGGVPAIKEVEFSITHNRGCFGACNFCSLAFHQGRQVTVRSEKSVLDEAEKLTRSPRFKGYIHDVGGPTANFRLPSCERQLKYGLCKGKKCLAPVPCKNLQVSHSEYLELLRKIRSLPNVKKVFIRSGVRFDYLIEDESDEFFNELVKYHISGQLRVAPEHCSAAVLDKMGKPHIAAYKRFSQKFYSITKSENLEQYIVPYLMSSHPGSTLKDAVELALFLKREKIHPDQVQDFYPTPGTISTAMYYTGIDPYTKKSVYVPKSAEDKKMQRALLQYFLPENKETVIKALIKAGRRDLIGTGKNCLVTPNTEYANRNAKNTKQRSHRKMGGKWEQNKRK